MLVFIGTYTAGESKGVYVYDFDPATGALTFTGHTAQLANPTFLAFHPNGQQLYAACEVDNYEGGPAGSVAALTIAADGSLTVLGQQSTGGAAPCHVSVDPTGRGVLFANYTGGSVGLLPLGEDGRVGPRTDFHQHTGNGQPGRQDGPHAHQITIAPGTDYVLACDLGLDQIVGYRLDLAAGRLVPHAPATVSLHAGAGPRHLAYHPSGRFAYVINELDSTLTAFTWDAGAGALTHLATYPTLPEGWSGTNYPADVHLSADGKFIYGTNRGHDSLVIFAVDAVTGRLTLVGHESTRGSFPRNFAIDPSGRWLLCSNQKGDNLVLYRRDQTTGQLTATGAEWTVPAPVCVLFKG